MSQPDLSGDYGYDLAHDDVQAERPAAPEPEGSPPRPAGGQDLGSDLEYDEAHDF